MNSLNRLFRCIAIVTLLGSSAAQATELRVPEAPTLVAPWEGGSMTLANPVELRWNLSGNKGASWYKVSLLLPDGTVRAHWTQDNYYIGENLEIGSYRWWVSPWNEQGFGESSESHFSIHPYHPGTAVNLAPNDSTISSTSVRLSWELTKHRFHTPTWSKVVVVRNGTPYLTKWTQLQSSLVWDAGLDAGLDSRLEADSIQLESLESGTYRWWVCPWDGVYGTWSEGASFTIVQQIPEEVDPSVTLGAPGSLEANISWTHDPVAKWYQVWTGHPLPGSPTILNKWFKASDIVVDNLAQINVQFDQEGERICYVRGWGTEGMGPWSSGKYFTLGAPLPLTASATEFTWDVSRCINPRAFQLKFQGTDEIIWHNVDLSESTLTGTERSFTSDAPLKPGEYKWQVIALSQTHGISAISEPLIITIQEPIPCTIPKTGQTTEFVAGDDGAYQAGVAWPEPRFVDTGNGTVIDMLTGLEWANNPQQFGSDSWSNAVKRCFDLEYAGHDDWHLPNLNEALSLIHYGKQNTIDWLNSAETPFYGIYSRPMTDHQPPVFYWTSTSNSAYPNSYAWHCDVPNGDFDTNESHKNTINLIWPVRVSDTTTASSPVLATGQVISYVPGDDGDLQIGRSADQRFTVTTEETVIDNFTNLEWMRAPTNAGTWAEGMAYCEQISFAGQDDWRLPNQNEMLSLLSFGNYDPALPTGHPFEIGNLGAFWSSTSSAFSPNAALNINNIWIGTSYLYSITDNKGGVKGFWPVRTRQD